MPRQNPIWRKCDLLPPLATIARTKSGTWKAIIRKVGWPTKVKTFRVKRDAVDWARRVEDEMVRGVFIDRAGAHRYTLTSALDRYLAEVTPTKKATTASREVGRAKILKQYLGHYSLTPITSELIAEYRDKRSSEGKSANSVRLELAMLSHLRAVDLVRKLAPASAQFPLEITAQIERIYRGVYLLSTLKRDEMIRDGRQEELDRIVKAASESQVSIHKEVVKRGKPAV